MVGEYPNSELLPLLQKYISEISDKMDETPWLSEIFDKYNLKMKRKRKKKVK